MNAQILGLEIDSTPLPYFVDQKEKIFCQFFKRADLWKYDECLQIDLMKTIEFPPSTLSMRFFFSVLIAASFSVCYALLSLTTDALGMLAIHRRNRELLLPWLIWYILDMGKKQ